MHPRRHLLPLCLASALTLLGALPSFAWGERGHAIVNEAATLSLPTDMPPFFYKAFPQLIWDASTPDRWKGAGTALDAANPPDHFLDYEYVSGLTLPSDRYKFIDLLYKSGTLRRNAISNSTIGFLPWRIAELSERLTNEWRQWRAAPAGSRERDFIEFGIIRDAGLLSHFVGDASNPHHTTYNFNGWVVDNPNGYSNDCDAHDRFERYFVTRAVRTSDVTPLVKPAPTLRSDYFRAAMEEIREAHGLVDTLYRLDRDGSFASFKPISRDGLTFTAARLAAGASMLRDLWWSSWQNSGRPPRRHGAPAED